MKPDKHFFTAVGLVLAGGLLIALTWIGTIRAIQAQNDENMARVRANLTNQALSFAEQINRQILAIDQTLRIIVGAWQTDPRHFDLETWRNQAEVLTGLSRDMVLTDEHGIIRQSSVADAVNQNASGLDYFRVLAQQSDPNDHLYIGPATIDGVMRTWHMNLARTLRYPDGSFAGVLDADYRVSAITDVFAQTDLGPNAFITLIGLDDGKLRGAVGPAASSPDSSIADTEMFATIRNHETGTWTGPSATDAIRRIHAFRRLPGHNLSVVVAMDEAEAMRPAAIWRADATFFASLITILLGTLVALLIQGIYLTRKREIAMAANGASLAASNAQLEVARALAAAKAEQLEVTLSGMTDGVAMIDANLCLAEWNNRFPEIEGVPAEILRVGLPVEEMIRTQIQNGQFGLVPNPEAEVERQLARMRATSQGVQQRTRPDGHTIEMRRNRLPDGGFVTLYSDITEHKQAEEALRGARETAERASNEKSRLVAVVSHEIRTPLNALLNTMRLLSDGELGQTQKSLLSMALQSGEGLAELLNDILDFSQMEAGKLTIRPTMFELRPLLEGCTETFSSQAAGRGMRLQSSVGEGVPPMLNTDPARLRQVLLNLVSNAVKYSNPGDVWLTAETSARPGEALRIAVQDDGPVIPPEARATLFRAFTRLDRPQDAAAGGTGLGLAICHHLVTLMGGKIGCEVWRSAEGKTGNVFWVTLPPSVVAGPIVAAPAAGVQATALQRRRPPRTRVLLTEDVLANQLVTATLLRREGHYVDIAASGEEALEALRSTPYDIVFMDIYMPGMGGLAATRAIRGMTEPMRSVPVIALTGSVSAEDEESFANAGMDGVMPKPVSPADLIEALEQIVWLRHAAAAAAPASEPAPPDATVAAMVMPAAPSPPQNRHSLLATERIDELRSNLAAETFSTLMEECLVDLDGRMPPLRRALRTNAPAAVNAHAHAMAGLAASYGMAALEARLRTLMAVARADKLDTLSPNTIQELDAEVAETARQLRELLAHETA